MGPYEKESGFHIGRRIAEILQKRGIPKSHLARQLGKSPSNFYPLLEKEVLSVNDLISISLALKHNLFVDLALYMQIQINRKDMEQNPNDKAQYLLAEQRLHAISQFSDKTGQSILERLAGAEWPFAVDVSGSSKKTGNDSAQWLHQALKTWLDPEYKPDYLKYKESLELDWLKKFKALENIKKSK